MTETNTGGAAPAAGSGAAVASVAANGGGAAPDWGGANPGDFHSLLPQDYRADPVFQNFKGPVKEAFPKLAKSYVESQKLIGVPPEQIVRLPKADAAPEAWDSVWNKLGRPETPDKYELRGPEGLALSPKLDAVARAAFHKNGVPAKAAAEIFKAVTEGQKAEYDAMMAERKAEAAKAETTFKARWGEKYDEQMNTAKMAFDRLLTPELKKAFVNTGLDSHPDMIALMNKLGHTLKEDTMLGGDGGSANQARDFATVQSERVKVHQEFIKLKDPLAPEYKTKHAQLQKLLAEEAALHFEGKTA